MQILEFIGLTEQKAKFISFSDQNWSIVHCQCSCLLIFLSSFNQTLCRAFIDKGYWMLDYTYEGPRSFPRELKAILYSKNRLTIFKNLLLSNREANFIQTCSWLYFDFRVFYNLTVVEMIVFFELFLCYEQSWFKLGNSERLSSSGNNQNCRKKFSNYYSVLK